MVRFYAAGARPIPKNIANSVRELAAIDPMALIILKTFLKNFPRINYAAARETAMQAAEKIQEGGSCAETSAR
jgi:hypothetical protein